MTSATYGRKHNTHHLLKVRHTHTVLMTFTRTRICACTTNTDTTTYVSVPAVGGEHLILLVEVENLNKSESVLDVNRLARVVDGTTHQPHLLIVVEQVFD